MAAHRVGELDQRISITRESLTTDSMGGSVVAVNVLVSAYAKVIAKGGSERHKDDQIEAPAKYLFTIRNRTDIEILEKDRINWEGAEYNISFVAREGKRALFLTLEAERGVAQ